MADIAFHGSNNIVTAAFRRIASAFSGYADAMRAAIRAHDAYEAYNMLSDKTLAEMGMAREDIAAHVMKKYIARDF